MKVPLRGLRFLTKNVSYVKFLAKFQNEFKTNMLRTYLRPNGSPIFGVDLKLYPVSRGIKGSKSHYAHFSKVCAHQF